MDMRGKLAIVTAAASGMGREGCLQLARAGATVAAIDRDEARLGDLAAEASAAGGRVIALVADLSRPDACTRVIAEAAHRLGGADILWAHAGCPGPAAVEGLALDEFDLAVRLNLTCAVLCAAAVAEPMRKRGGGAIVFTSSVAGLVGSMASPVYSAMKFGIVGFAKSLAQRYAPDGIRVNAVCPGPVDTPMLPQFFTRGDAPQASEELRTRIVSAIPLGRVARAEEIARAAVWLASDDASYITGVALPVDGGFSCR